MKKRIYRILVPVALALVICAIEGKAQVTSDSSIDNEIKVLEGDVKAKQKRLLELKLQKLKKQQEDVQNELKRLETSDSSSTLNENLSQTENKVVEESKKPIVITEAKKVEVKNQQTSKIENTKPINTTVQPILDQNSDPKCNSLVMANRGVFDDNLCALTNEFYTNKDLMLGDKNIAVLLISLAKTDENIAKLIAQFENKRTDKQIGGDSNKNGTTSLAVKGGAPRIIGWAIENGAATSEVSGNTVSVRVNPVGLLEAISRGSTRLPFTRDLSFTGANTSLSLKDSNSPFTKFAKRASVGFFFDTTRGTNPPTFIGSKQQLSAVSFRYEFINHRDPLREEFDDDWATFFQTQMKTFTQQFDATDSLLFDPASANPKFRNVELQKWVDDTQAELLAISTMDANGNRDFTKIREIIEARLSKLPIAEILKDDAVKRSLTSLAEAGANLSNARKEFLKQLNKGKLVTFEYTNNRNVDTADTSNFNFIAEGGKKFAGGIMDFTFNGSLTMFNKKPTAANVKRIKDFNFALQADVPFLPDYLGDTFLSFSGKYVRQQSDVILPNGLTVDGTKGDIAIGQVKLTIPIPDWGIRFPISVTFANRTELVKESTVRGNFGITFDLDSMFGKKKIF